VRSLDKRAEPHKANRVRLRFGRRSPLVLCVVTTGALAATATPTVASAAEPAKVKCEGPALKKATGLPKGFPKPDEVTYVSAVKAGPSIIVQGYFAAGLDEALAEYRSEVKGAGYKNLKTEHDPHDAEINYEGAGRSGQIALRDNCKEAGTTFVQIVSRPAAGGGSGPALPATFTALRAAANDLVRETSFGDKEGAERAFDEVKKAFAKAKKTLAKRAPDETEAITEWIEKIDGALGAGNLKKAHTFAQNILKELKDAQGKLGTSAGPAKGLAGVFDQLEEKARDLAQEASFEDESGTKRALADFKKSFASVRKRIEAKSPKAEELIAGALEEVSTEVANDDKDGAKHAAKELVAAVNDAAKLAGA
jgi:hypothetical protein